MNFLYTTAIPPPLPPPQPSSGGRGTILSQEARLHALQIAEEIQAERGSYRKWNEVAKAVNRQYGSNVDGDLVKRQVTSMLRSVQRSGLNSVKRPRKHAEVIQQLLDPVAKRQCIPLIGADGVPLRIRAAGEEDDEGIDGSEGGEGMDVRASSDIITLELNGSDRGSNTGSESGTPPGSPRVSEAANPANFDTSEPSSSTSTSSAANTTTTTTSTSPAALVPSASPSPSPLPTTELPTTASTTPPKPIISSTTPSTSTTSEDTSNSKTDQIRVSKSTPQETESHSIERVTPKKRSNSNMKQHQLKFKQLPTHPQPSAMISLQQHFPPPTPQLRILPNMPVDEVYNLVVRLHPDVDAEFIRTQEIDGSAFQTLTHRELTEFGVPTFGKRNKLLQLCISFDQQQAVVGPAPSNPQEFFYGRLPANFPNPTAFLEAKAEAMAGDKHESKESTEKKPPVTKVLDLEVVGVRKRYLVERENGAVEVLTPCKLRKYKALTAAFEHIHPDKLIPISSFSTPFTHVPNNAEEKSSDPSTPATPPSPRTAKPKATSKPSPSTKAPAFVPPSAYFPVYYPSSIPPYPVSAGSHPSGNLQWVSSPYPGVSPQRAPEKYHSFHPYTPPQTPK